MASAIPPNTASLKTQCLNQHQATMMDNLNNMRKRGILCDVTLVVQGKFFVAHRAVIAAGSHFFSLMFTTKMKEYKSQKVELRDVDPTIFELLIEFLYTAKILLDRSNVQSLLEAANQYQIEPVKKMCVEFLKGQLHATNCLGISALADYMDCAELKAVAEEFVLWHFTEVYKQEEFLKLDARRLAHLLHQDKIAVRSEAQIYDAAVRWLKYDVSNREQYIVEVLGCVRFPLISMTFLSKTLQHESLIQDNPEWQRMVISGMRSHQQNSGVKLQPRRNKYNVIAVFGGPRLQTTDYHYFYPKEGTWTEVGSSSIKSQEATAVFCNDVVYIMGGHRAYQMAAYNVLTSKWQLLPAPPTNRKFLAACASEGTIYTSGGAIGNSTLTVFECFDTDTGLWHVKPSMVIARYGHGSVEVNGLIYVCGGTYSNSASSRILNNCEVFDPKLEQWRRICRMKEARKNHGLVVVNNRIYAIGGQGATGGLKSVEYYDIDSNKWHSASPVPWQGVSLKCAAVEETIYVLAGKGIGEWMPHLKHVLEYNTCTDRWITCYKTEAFSQPTCLTCVITVPLSEDQCHTKTSSKK